MDTQTQQTQSQQNAPRIIGAGTFKSKPLKATLSETKSGNPQAVIDLELLEGPDAGKVVSYYGSLSEGAFEFTMGALRASGWYGTDFDQLAVDEKTFVRAVIEHEVYEGKKKAKVRWVNPIGSGAKPVEAAKAKSIAAQFKAKAMAYDQAKGTQAPTPPPPENTGVGNSNDDIPF